jgi:hypothetical protein
MNKVYTARTSFGYLIFRFRFDLLFFPDRIELDFEKKEVRVFSKDTYRIKLSDLSDAEVSSRLFGMDMILNTRTGNVRICGLSCHAGLKIKSLINSYLWQYTFSSENIRHSRA